MNRPLNYSKLFAVLVRHLEGELPEHPRRLLEGREKLVFDLRPTLGQRRDLLFSDASLFEAGDKEVDHRLAGRFGQD